MSNSGKTEALPKSGHVNEVCKEWLVREDGALAYKLQSQEINDFYKGNRFRNAVVREDFPTALHEQIKEKENAEKQKEVYRLQLLEQEKYDKCIAKEIADKLERDLQEQEQRELKESETVALKMQEIYVNLPGTKQNESLQMSIPPPRPAKSQISCKLGNPIQRHQPTVSGLVVKLSLEKYDELVGNIHKEEDIQIQGAAAVVNTEQHMQLHADDIELYVDPCNYASLQHIGVPLEEIKEINEKIKQEQKDELLARRLQEIEAKKSYNQEQRDRLLAIEEQDKELARILQEKERAKAKRAKDKARLRKTQQHQVKSANSVHCGPLFPMPQDCMQAVCVSPKHDEDTEECKLKVIDTETYSNPIDILQKQQTRITNNTLTNGSLTRDRHVKDPTSTPTIDDDIYTLPVDNCYENMERPQSLNISPEREQQMSLTMSESYAFENTDLLNLKASKSSSLAQNCSQTPPYMPIQGTRRTNSTEDRKKKTKDKCTHQ